MFSPQGLDFKLVRVARLLQSFLISFRNLFLTSIGALSFASMAEPLKWLIELSSDDSDLEDPKAGGWWVVPEKWRKHSSALLLPSTWALKAAAMRVQRSNTSRTRVWMYTIGPKSWFLNEFWLWLKGWPKKVEVMLSATVQSSPKILGFLFEGQSLYRLVDCQPQGILKYQASRFRCCKKHVA